MYTHKKTRDAVFFISKCTYCKIYRPCWMSAAIRNSKRRTRDESRGDRSFSQRSMQMAVRKSSEIWARLFVYITPHYRRCAFHFSFYRVARHVSSSHLFRVYTFSSFFDFCLFFLSICKIKIFRADWTRQHPPIYICYIITISFTQIVVVVVFF